MLRVAIEIYNTHYRVKVYDVSLHDIIKHLCDELTTYKYDIKVQPGFSKFKKKTFYVKVKDSEFFYFNPKTNIYHFPIHTNRNFLLLLGNHNVRRDEISIQLDRTYEAEKIKIKVRDVFIPREYQHKYVNVLTNENSKNIMLIDLRTGYGKASSVDSLIRIPDGWKRMGDIKLNDSVIAKDGTTTKVTAIYPQGMLDLYRIRFADGRTHECCLEHLWKVYTPRDKYGYSILNTKQIMDKIYNPDVKSLSNRRRLYIDLPDSEDNPEKDYAMHPYVLGVLLGDGGFTTGYVGLTVSDVGVAERFGSLLDKYHYLFKEKHSDYGYKVKIIEKLRKNHRYNGYLQLLKDYGLHGLMSHEKFIPVDYLNGSTEQRYELLRGLMDTDGEVAHGGTLVYGTSSKRLCDDVVSLVRSLGGYAKVRTSLPKYTYLNELKVGRLAYRITIRLKEPTRCITRVYRRLERLKVKNQYSDTLKLRIDDIEYIGKKEAQCISIEHPDRLYVTGDYVVTHNTLVFSLAACVIQERIGILIKPAYIDKTILDMKKYLDVDDDDIYVIQGEVSLIELVSEINPKYKIIIFSMRTLINYIENYLAGEIHYQISPLEIMRVLRIGLLFNDETHQEFHALFTALLHCDVKKVIGSTATFESSDSYTNKMYEYLFPLTNRISNLVEYDRYLHVFAIRYETNSLRGVQFKRARGYSQTLYEQSIIKNHLFLRDYLAMIMYYVEVGYYKRKEKGDKVIIFAGSIHMCTLITNHIAKQYKDLDVRRYVEDDKFENLLEGDVLVSTQGSAGTAVDIPNLISVIQTISMSSMQANEQNAGRLRNLAGKEMRYYYLFCKGIKQHWQHHLDRKQAISKLALSYITDDYRTKLRVK